MIKILRDVNIHQSFDFDRTSVIGITKAGEVFTVVDFVKMDGTCIYRLKSWVYITASKRYVGDFRI